VTLVTEFLISCRGMLRPSLAAMNASGYPVALEARAEDLDRRAFTYGGARDRGQVVKENIYLDDAILL